MGTINTNNQLGVITMNTYAVTVVETVYCLREIKANSEQEAIDKATKLAGEYDDADVRCTPVVKDIFEI
jgi:hypothetical protein